MSVASIRARLERDPRLKRVFHGSVSAVAGRGLAVVINAVLLPLVLRYLGKVEFGIWVTISTSVLMLAVLDLGIANTLTNFIAEAHVEDNHQKAAQYYASAFWITTVVTVPFSVLSYLAWHSINWAKVFHVTDQVQADHARFSVAIAVGFFLFSLPLTLANKVFAGYQQIHLANYFAMINSALSLLAIVGTILLKGSIVELMAAYCVAMLTGTVALNLWLHLWQRPWLLPVPRLATYPVIRKLLGQGYLFFIIQCTGLVVFGCDNLIISHYMGPDKVTPYSFAWRLISYATMLQAIILPSLWPAFTEAYHKRQMDWVQVTYNSLARKSFILVGLLASALALTGRFIIRIWAGHDAVPDQGLLWLMAAFNVVMAATTNQAFLLNATSRLRVEAAAAVLAAVSNLICSIYLVKIIGVNGVILSTLLSFLTFMIIPQHIEVRRVLTGKYLEMTPLSQSSSQVGT